MAVCDLCLFLNVLWVCLWSATFPGQARVLILYLGASLKRYILSFLKDTIFVALDILDLEFVRQYEFNSVRTQQSI